MTSETGKKGITLIEILVVVVIIGLLIGFSVFFPHKAISRINLDNACKSICETLQTARYYAIAEKQNFRVFFGNNSYGIYRIDGTLVGKVIKLPQFIIIKEKTDGFSPAEFLPQGTARQAGYLVLQDTSSKKTAKIVLYNLTGKTKIEKNE
ncbi:MAG: prepilin-type N-terminal cleavage/methylation domain-containing protein [Candidatus Omnitrophica bacterium]|nr:prepilin-type N-terminal cleavage/methylation domain-containing protein [Candidatus Omnitrophota bacterium]MCM8821651.1 prepilin-type N-terminal cleavage/methylation domain-containing protein [Candidatus Omnitrophota bacterium]MCM8825515.1 prepilin-type N-terminal cleavage/methylation domain-containing protein [Candidatus Omnitrophota bacterium]MCM8828891.1 prepilin-type N-terminal cleavage/methylation domain-containing protein [Candidatus Omnitrophota bacterium]